MKATKQINQNGTFTYLVDKNVILKNSKKKYSYVLYSPDGRFRHSFSNNLIYIQELKVICNCREFAAEVLSISLV
jgi:hypothetical protein